MENGKIEKLEFTYLINLSLFSIVNYQFSIQFGIRNFE